MRYIKYFEEIRIADVKKVGGKNASLGEMVTQLSSQGIRVPTGFAVTADAYWHYINANNLLARMKHIMGQLRDAKNVHKVGSAMRKLIMSGCIPDDLAQEIIAAYHTLSARYKKHNIDVAVRSSATAEDLPTASFAGQQDTFLNVVGDKELLDACKKSIASLFTDRAIIYRIDKKFDHFKVALSIGVQKMIRSDKAVSGVAFSLDTESGFKDVVMIEASYGLGESIVQGLVTPDEYVVHKPTLELGYTSIIKKRCGDKKTKIVYGAASTKTVKVAEKDRSAFVLSDKEIIELAKYVVTIENYYSSRKKAWSPMDIEWAKDAYDEKLYIVQARPETVYAGKKELTLQQYSVKGGTAKQVITTGLSIGHKIVSGVARVVKGAQDIGKVRDGDIIVTTMTDPDWVPAMKRAAGIITNRGGRTCHAAIVSRELGIPAIVGTENGTTTIKNGDKITIDCSGGAVGTVYKGALEYRVKNIAISDIPKLKVDVMVNIADPDSAFQTSMLPVAGVGLARLEFIITNSIKIHPMALMYLERVKDKRVRDKINKITASYDQKTQFFIERLAEGIGMIAAAFYPRPVSVRLSDFKSNEYRNLIGGSYFEPVEENPMIGFRGASRYHNDLYKQAFALECKALVHARDVMGLKNIKIMIPFVRTVQEAQRVEAEMAKYGLNRSKDLEFVMMCEVPSNVIMIDEFSRYFDGFSIGSNDLTQLVLGVDRDSTILATLFDERDEAVKRMMEMAIEGAHKQKRYIGICGQAPSDYPEIAEFLIKAGIDSLSLNVDSVLPFLMKSKKK